MGMVMVMVVVVVVAWWVSRWHYRRNSMVMRRQSLRQDLRGHREATQYEKGKVQEQGSFSCYCKPHILLKA